MFCKKVDNEEKAIKSRDKFLDAFKRLTIIEDLLLKQEVRGKVGEKISDIIDNRSFTAGSGCASESYKRSAFIGNRDCNCTIHDSAFQDRSFESE